MRLEFRLTVPGSLIISLVWSNSLWETLILRCVRTEFTDVETLAKGMMLIG